jgi:hypothetical protein
MDMELVEQQMRQKMFDLPIMISYILDSASAMCAPIRDPEIQQARDAKGSAEQLRCLAQLANNMALDNINFKLKALRPHMIGIAVSYERANFARKLENGEIGLRRTLDWIDTSTHGLCLLVAERNPECVEPAKNNRPSYNSIYETAFLKLLGKMDILYNTQYLPETFALDTDRMATFQNEIQGITMVSALLMLARNFGTIHDPQVLSALSDKFFSMLEDVSTSTNDLATEIIETVMVDPEKQQMCKCMVDKTLQYRDSFFRMVFRRVLSVIKSTIHHNRFVSDAILASHGLGHVKDNLELVSCKIAVLAKHNMAVYSPWYEELMENALYKYVVDRQNSG